MPQWLGRNDRTKGRRRDDIGAKKTRLLGEAGSVEARGRKGEAGGGSRASEITISHSLLTKRKKSALKTVVFLQQNSRFLVYLIITS